jgi:hypothetical protein
MLINRNNYEQFFLLYADGELNAAEKAAVDAFVLANPDLATELQMLNQAILQPEQIVFPNKSNLLKQTPESAEWQEQLLLKLDGELDKRQLAKIDQILNSDAAAVKEWQLLQQTQLSAEVVLYPNKASLYRHQERRVVAMRWYQIAAAAMLLGFGVWGAVTVFTGTSEPSVASGTVQPGKTTIATPNQNNVAVPTPAINRSDAASISPNNNTNKASNPSDMIKGTVDKKPGTANPTNGNEYIENSIALEEKPVLQSSQKLTLTNINNNPSNISSAPSVSPIITSENTTATEIAVNNANATATTETFTRLLQDEDKQNQTVVYGFAEDEEEPKRTKLGIFIKKLRRTIQRKANMPSGDGNLRVANMSFAVK